jgi:ribosome-binding factor A
MRKNSIKNTRINGEVKRELSTLISREIKDPRINPMTSVVSVEVSPDLKTAKVFISVLGDQDSKESTLRGLRSAASFIRGQLARTLNLRNTPELTFILDNSIEYGVHMSKLIDEVNRNSSHENAVEDMPDQTSDFEDEDDDNYDDEEEDTEDTKK